MTSLRVPSGSSRLRPVPLLAALLLVSIAPVALAQTTGKPKKKGAKPAATAEPAPEPTTDSSSSDSAPAATTPPDDEGTKKPDKAATSAASENTSGEVPPTATQEKAGQRYYFVGLRYRVTIIPQFMVNLFVNEGATFVSHSVAAELDMRKDGQSTIPWIAYQSFGFGDTLFLQKNGTPPADQASNWSVVNSGLSALFLGLDELWSVPIDSDHHWDFEYGFGVGIGVVFGSLQNNWVYDSASGPLVSSTGRHFAQCTTADMASQTSCTTGGHNNAQTAKIVTSSGPYSEPNWFNGGSIPVVFPHIAFPQIGLRWKPVKQFQMRISTGFSLTGFFFGINGYYGLEKQTTGEKAETSPRWVTQSL
jgi:hypothetical protein